LPFVDLKHHEFELKPKEEEVTFFQFFPIFFLKLVIKKFRLKRKVNLVYQML
jgi:hypothetical protein